VLAPGTVEECFEAGWRAFNLAERYQCPVIVLTDLYLSGSLRTVDLESLDAAAVPIERGALLTEADLEQLDGEYRRFELTASGISPRAVPGHPAAVYLSASDEHTEEGHITEEIHNRVAMMRKRMRKEDTAQRESIRAPRRYGVPDPELLLVCWGSCYGPVREAVDLLSERGERASMLHFGDLWPFPADAALRTLEAAPLTVGVEQNYTGQLAKLIRMTTGHELQGRILSYDGRPFSPQEIVAAVGRVQGGETEIHVESGEPPLPAETEVGVNV